MKTKIIIILMTFCQFIYSQTTIFSSDFETWNVNNPANWGGSTTNIDTTTKVVKSTDFYAGQYSLQLINDTTTHKRFSTTGVSVTANQVYAVSFWAKGHGNIRVGFNSGGPNYPYSSYSNLNSSTWTKYTHTIIADATTATGQFILSVQSTNADLGHLKIDDLSIRDTTIAPVSIYDIQYTTDPAGNSPKMNQLVTFSGTCTAVYTGKGYYMKDGHGPWRGIYVYTNNTNTPQIGDSIQVTGTVVEYNGLTEITNSTYTLKSVGNTLTPTLVTCSQINTEAYEGVFVKVENIQITAMPAAYGIWTIQDDTGTTKVDDDMYNPGITIALYSYYNITGICTYTYSEWKILPRHSGDITCSIELTTQLLDTTICANINFSLTVYYCNLINSFQWYKNGVSIQGANNPTFTIQKTSISDTGSYFCIGYSNTYSADTSSVVHLSIFQTPIIDLGFDKSICFGNSTILSNNVSGGIEPYSFNWAPSLNLNNPQIQEPTTLINTSSSFYVTITDANGCKNYDTININVVKPYENNNICIVSVDTSIWKNKIYLINTLDVGIVQYKIYKESSINDYTFIGAIDFNTPCFIDNTSQPESHGDKYKITAIDTCGNESAKSPYHKTMNLTIAVNGTTMGLNWDDYVDESGSFVPSKFYIYRGVGNNLLLYDSISASFHSYNDYNVIQSYYYMIGIKKNTACNSSKANANYSFSNKKQNFSSSIEEVVNNNNCRVYPNPLTESAILEFENKKSEKYQLIIRDLQGKVVKSYENITTNKYTINKDKIANGIYSIELYNKKLIFKDKLIVK